MGGGEASSHACNALGTLSAKPGWGGGQLPNSNGRGRPELNRGTVWRVPISVIVVGRAINGEGNGSHDCYAFVVEKGNGVSAGGPEKGLIRPKMYYLWRGKSRDAPCGAIRQAVLPLIVATRYGN